MRPKDEDELAAATTALASEDPNGAEEYRQVLEALQELRPDDRNVVFKMKSTPIRALGGRTLEEAVLSGDAEKALRYLQTVSGGQNG